MARGGEVNPETMTLYSLGFAFSLTQAAPYEGLPSDNQLRRKGEISTKVISNGIGETQISKGGFNGGHCAGLGLFMKYSCLDTGPSSQPPEICPRSTLKYSPQLSSRSPSLQ